MTDYFLTLLTPMKVSTIIQDLADTIKYGFMKPADGHKIIDSLLSGPNGLEETQIFNDSEVPDSIGKSIISKYEYKPGDQHDLFELYNEIRNSIIH